MLFISGTDTETTYLPAKTSLNSIHEIIVAPKVNPVQAQWYNNRQDTNAEGSMR